MIYRNMTLVLKKAAKQFPIVGVMGPRQSGKTTLTKTTFPNYTYITLEDLDIKLQAKEDPRKFFATYSQGEGLIIDEIQEVPSIRWDISEYYDINPDKRQFKNGAPI